MNNTVLKVNVYNIDDEIKLQKINKVQASDYVNSIIKNGLNNKNVRYFRVKRNTTEVINIINKIVKDTNYASESGAAATLESGAMDSFTVATKKIAEKLQENEKIAQERIINLNVDVKKGSLIQALVKDEDGLLNYILAKVEHVNILDNVDWEKHTGLPLEKQILKTCVISYDEDIEICEIKIFDSNNRISDYWKDGFLELEPHTKDDINTKKSLQEINRFLVRNIKSKSTADYNLLYNSVIGYYDQNNGFDYDDMLDKVFYSYTPINKEKVNLEDYKEVLAKLPEKKFDRKFDIIPDAIRKKKVRTFSIGEEIELKLKDNIENLNDVIKAIKDDDTDEAYLKIKVSEEIFNEFKFS